MSDFGHRLAIANLRDGQRIALRADEAECAASAHRLRLAGIERFEAHVAIGLEGDRVTATGRLRAALRQHCVASGEPVQASVDEAFEIVFEAEPTVRGDDEIELNANDCDVVFHDGREIPLGDSLADTLGLALDPYPRSPGAESALKAAGVLSEEQAGPFAALAALKREVPDGV